MPGPIVLTKADTVALWHALQGYKAIVAATPQVLADDPEGAQQLLALERGRLKAAHQALRKVNALRKQQQGR